MSALILQTRTVACNPAETGLILQASLSKFSPQVQGAGQHASAQAGQPNGPGQSMQRTQIITDPGSVRLDPLGRPMSIDHEHQVSMLPSIYLQ